MSSPAPREGRLAGKVVVCTGGGSGIGRAAVDTFAAEGARVGVLDRDPAKVSALEDAGPARFAMVGDARSGADTRLLVDAAVERWGRVDVAVTFVGIFDHYRKLVDLDDADLAKAFDELFGVNVLSALVLAHATAGLLTSSKGTLIVTLSTSSYYPGRGGVLYVGSKFALRGVVVELAHELAPDVRVNAVAPGGTVDTDLAGAATLGEADRRLDDRPGRREGIEARTPLQVALTPADHAGAYLFLASDESRGMTGEVIRVDGGIGAR